MHNKIVSQCFADTSLFCCVLVASLQYGCGYFNTDFRLTSRTYLVNQLHQKNNVWLALWLIVTRYVRLELVSASDVTPTDRWLNVWYIWHTKVETLQECRSHRRIGWIIQDFWETCVSRSLTFRLETKMPWRQTPSWKKKSVVFTNVTTKAYQGQLNAWFSKVCEIFKVCGIASLKYIREFHTPVWNCGDIYTHRNMTLN